jgi:hypothetical protein
MRDDELLTTRQAAQMLCVSVAWLAKARCKKSGPTAVYLSPRVVRYRRSTLVAYIEERSYRSTSENTVRVNARAAHAR